MTTRRTNIPTRGIAPIWLAIMGASAVGTYFFGSKVVAGLGAIFITIAAWILGAFGQIFNFVFTAVITDFRTTLASLGIEAGINTVWTVLRDLSNILIIGLFVFIAISIILGLKKFGDKKLIANALIVAILMNFSLLFAKSIIDVSNYFAHQFYVASLSSMIANGTVATTADARSVGISGAFLKYMGVTGFFDTAKQIDAAGTEGGAFASLAYAIVVMLLLLAVAIVLFYGIFVIGVRAVMLVFLMVFSPVAFASYLLPSWHKLPFGWEWWWSNLLRCAVFAPLLTICLWASLLLLQKAPANMATMGAVLGDPRVSTAAATSSVMLMIFAIGLLFASIRLSSSLAGSVAGFSLALAMPFRLAAGVTAPALRQTLGRFNVGRADRFAKDAKGDREKANSSRVRAEIHDLAGDRVNAAKERATAVRLDHTAGEKADKAAKAARWGDKKYNFADTKVVQAATKGLGIAVPGSSKDTKGFSSQIKDTAKHAAEIAEKAGEATREELAKNQKMLEGAIQTRTEVKVVEKSSAHADADKVLSTVKEAAQAQRELINDERRGHETNLQDAKAKKVDHEKKIIQLEGDPNKSVDEKVLERAEHEQEISRQTDRIKRASTDLENVEAKSEALSNQVFSVQTKSGIVPMSEAQAKKLRDDAKQEFEQARKSIRDIPNQARQQAARIAAETTGNIVENVARHEAGILGRAVGIDDYVAKSARDQSKSNKELKNLKKIIESETKRAEPDHTPPPPPAAGGGGGDHH